MLITEAINFKIVFVFGHAIREDELLLCTLHGKFWWGAVFCLVRASTNGIV
jgi:hypothetical protein